MEFEEEKIKLDRKLSKLDRKTLYFVEILENQDLDYSIVSGYVAILLGRSRGSEDIDILVDLDREEFNDLWEKLREEDYWCINSGKEEAWDMMQESLSVRFAEEGKAIPNFEVFLPEDEYENIAISNSMEVELEEGTIRVSPLELQICYKLMLGSEKDFEDAFHIYTVSKQNLQPAKLDDYARTMDVGDELGELEAAANT